MKVKDLQKAIKGLDQDAEVTLTYPGFLGDAEWDQPLVLKTNKDIFIMPKAAEEAIEADHSREQVAEMIQKAYDQYQSEQDSAA